MRRIWARLRPAYLDQNLTAIAAGDACPQLQATETSGYDTSFMGILPLKRELYKSFEVVRLGRTAHHER